MTANTKRHEDMTDEQLKKKAKRTSMSVTVFLFNTRRNEYSYEIKSTMKMQRNLLLIAVYSWQ